MNNILNIVIGLMVHLIASICFGYLIVTGIQCLLKIFNKNN